MAWRKLGQGCDDTGEVHNTGRKDCCEGESSGPWDQWMCQEFADRCELS